MVLRAIVRHGTGLREQLKLDPPMGWVPGRPLPRGKGPTGGHGGFAVILWSRRLSSSISSASGVSVHRERNV